MTFIQVTVTGWAVIIHQKYSHKDEWEFDFNGPKDPKDIHGEMMRLFTKFTHGCVTVLDNTRPG
jgi:hypothetical protein